MTEITHVALLRSLVLTLALGLPLLVSGCAQVPSASSSARLQRALPASASEAVTGIALVVNIAQHEIAIERQVVNSTYTYNANIPLAVSLAASVIDGFYAYGRDKEAEEAIVPVRAVMKMDLTNAVLSEAVHSRSSRLPWKVESYAFTSMKEASDFDTVVRSTRSAALLLVDMGYSLSPDAKYLTVSAFAMLSPASQQLRKQQTALFAPHPTQDAERLRPASPLNAMYFNRLVYTKKLDDIGHVADLRAIWLKDGAKKLREGLDEASAGVVEMLLLDLRQTVQDPSLALPTGERFPISHAEAVRAPDGSLMCITN